MSTRSALLVFVCAGLVFVAAAMIVARTKGALRADAKVAGRGIEFAGCAAVVRGPACELAPDGHLHLWAPSPASVTIHVATERGALAASNPTEVEGGTGFDVTLPPDSTELRVESEAGDRWSLAIRRSPHPPWEEEIARLREAGELEAARTQLVSILTSARGADRARAEGQLARTELARSEHESAISHFRDAIALDRAEGLISSEADDSFALSFALSQHVYRYSEASAALAAAGDAIALYPEGQARLPFYDAILLEETADLHSALQRFDEARRLAARLGMRRLRRNAETSYALELAGTGRRAEALARLRALADTSDEGLPCDRVTILQTIGAWTLRSLDEADRDVDSRAQRQTSLQEAEEAFGTAATLYPRGCADAEHHAEVLLGLGEVALRRGDLRAARARLAEGRSALATHTPSLDVMGLDLQARIALAEHDARATLAAYDEEERSAGGRLPHQFAYDTAVGRGEALEALGRFEEALAQYERAEGLLEEESLWIPLSEGRLTFLADRQRSARYRIDLLLRLGRVHDAMAAARGSRVRAIAMFQRGERLESLDADQRARWAASLEAYRRLRDLVDARAEDDWKLPADAAARERARRDQLEKELRLAVDNAFAVLAQSRVPSSLESSPLQPDEVVLAYHPVRTGWVGFAARGDEVETFRFDLPAADASPEEVAARLLAPARVAIASATRIRVLACGPLRAVDFHALPFKGGMLCDQAVVTYGTDQASAPHAPPRGSRALIVADPNDNLAGTLEEAARVERAIVETRGWETLSLVRDEATSGRVRDALDGVSWFHFAGHGTFDSHHGLGGALVLANGTRLTVGDVLALAHAPSSVVLAGCDAGRADGEGSAGGLGLAQAFVAAGTRVAIAPVRPVRDDITAKLVSILYTHFASDEFDLSRALRDAQRRLRDSAPDSDWSAFRAVSP
jgi:tetratricopeptide (TPR) repeat protein